MKIAYAGKPSAEENGRSIPVTIRGQKFPSIQAAADHFGLHHSTVTKARDKGRLDYVGLGKGRGFKVHLNGTTYNSVREASAATGIPRAVMTFCRDEGLMDILEEAIKCSTGKQKSRRTRTKESGQALSRVS